MIMRQCDTTFDLKINMSAWPIFHGPVILFLYGEECFMDDVIPWDNESV